MLKLNVFSETGPLRCVLTRRPGAELELVTPTNMREMLVDDIIDVPVAQQEHDVFTNFLRTQKVDVIEFDSLLTDVLANPDQASQVIYRAFARKVRATDSRVLTSSYDVEHIKRYLIFGESPEGAYPLVKPVVNTVFTRDIGAVIGNKILPGMASKVNRKREMRISQMVFRLHPSFSKAELYEPSCSIGSIEGGDILVISSEVACIGISERTKRETVESIVPLLHENGVRHVIGVNLERKRSCMHLDTIMTLLDNDHCLVYAPMILNKRSSQFCKATLYSKGKRQKEVLKGVLHALSLVGILLTPIPCGGGDPIQQEREQYTDAANTLAIRPGHILIYRRNRQTISTLVEKWGYVYVNAEDVTGPLDPDTKFVISMPGFELSRARGGAHCMSFPLMRD